MDKTPLELKNILLKNEDFMQAQNKIFAVRYFGSKNFYGFAINKNKERLEKEGRLDKTREEGGYLVYNLKNDEIEFFTLDEKEKILEKFGNISFCEKGYCSSSISDSFNYFKVLNIDGEEAVYCKIINKAVKVYKAHKEESAKNKIFLLDYFNKNFFLLFKDGTLYFADDYCKDLTLADCSNTQFYKNYFWENCFYINQDISSRKLTEIHSYKFEDVYRECISKVFPEYMYYKGMFFNIKKDFAAFCNCIIGYKEPSLKSGKNQKLITELGKKELVENDLSIKIKKSIDNDLDRIIGEYAIINRLNTKEDICVIRRFYKNEKKEHSRIYVFKDRILSTFRNRYNEWVLSSMPKLCNADNYGFSIPSYLDYDKSIFKGTLLEYTREIAKNAIEKRISKKDVDRSTLVGQVIFILLRLPINEEFLKTEYAKDLIPDDFYYNPSFAERLFGKTKANKKGFYQKIGLTNKQVMAIYSLSKKSAKIYYDKDAELSKREKGYFSKTEDEYRHEIFSNLVHKLKFIFSDSDSLFFAVNNYVDISYVDYNVFINILDLFSLPLLEQKNNYICSRINIEYLSEILSKIKAFYSKDVFLRMIDYLKTFCTKSISKEVRRWSGDTIITDIPAINVYLDYLNMLIESQECRNFPWKFNTIQEIKEAHDNFIDIYNRYRNFLESPEYTNQKFKSYEKDWQPFEFSHNEFLITYPKNAEEVFEEGKKLKHCVGSFVSKIAKGETNIFFLRKIEDPEKPFFTVELKDGTIRQVHGFANKNAEEENGVEEFLELWAKNKKIKYQKNKAKQLLA